MEHFIIQILRQEFLQSCAHFCSYQHTPEEVTDFATTTIDNLHMKAVELGFTPTKSKEELIEDLIIAINKRL